MKMFSFEATSEPVRIAKALAPSPVLLRALCGNAVCPNHPEKLAALLPKLLAKFKPVWETGITATHTTARNASESHGLPTTRASDNFFSAIVLLCQYG
jgi:hypothetical protein